MPLRSVIDIEVRDAALDSALQKLAQLQAAKGMILPLGAPGARPGATPGTQQREQSLAVQAMQRIGLSQQQAERSATAMAKSWAAIRDHVERVGRTMSGLIREMTSFTGMMGLATGAATLGGMFGMDAIGRMASGLRMRSLALSPGADVGQMQAFGIGARRLGVGPETLQAISNMMQSPATRGILTGIMGANVSEEMDPSAAAWEVLAGLRRRGQQFRAQGMPIASILQATQANQIGIDAPTMMRMMNMRDDEFNRQRNVSAARGGQLGITDEQLKRWQNFMDTVDTAKQRIEKTFIVGLGNLTEPMSRLVDSLTNMLQALLEGPRIKQWIENLREAIDHATEWLKDPSHKQDIDQFFTSIGNAIENLGKFALALAGLVDWIATHFKGIVIGAAAVKGGQLGASIGGAIGTAVEPGGGTLIGAGLGAGIGAAVAGGAAWLGMNKLLGEAVPVQAKQPFINPAPGESQIDFLHRLESLRGLPRGMLVGIYGAETNFGANTRRSSAGAMGPMQFMPETWSVFGQGKDVNDFYAAANAAANLSAFNLSQTKGDVPRAIAAYNTGLKRAAQPSPMWPAETQGYVPKVERFMQEDQSGGVVPQAAAIGRQWQDQQRQTSMANQARPVSTLAARLPTDGSASSRLNNILITLRSEAGGNAFVSAGAMAT